MKPIELIKLLRRLADDLDGIVEHDVFVGADTYTAIEYTVLVVRYLIEDVLA